MADEVVREAAHSAALELRIARLAPARHGPRLQRQIAVDFAPEEPLGDASLHDLRPARLEGVRRHAWHDGSGGAVRAVHVGLDAAAVLNSACVDARLDGGARLRAVRPKVGAHGDVTPPGMHDERRVPKGPWGRHALVMTVREDGRGVALRGSGVARRAREVSWDDFVCVDRARDTRATVGAGEASVAHAICDQSRAAFALGVQRTVHAGPLRPDHLQVEVLVALAERLISCSTWRRCVDRALPAHARDREGVQRAHGYDAELLDVPHVVVDARDDLVKPSIEYLAKKSALRWNSASRVAVTILDKPLAEYW
eukprot:CAMPEP_0206242992 /NCGR_PEP_ID=MMETSP0047_2-20121206/17360_1 /ASSEMBLY_ACC=CAM_ASM_000192 /TAXON_ID=195065 /ORGANISM="Chroomonas mesostigmatica_cf, Strain CCMP1168" /LENGTH=311 /DNA_ID=CAMNT_0053668063 /DNA_START=320 /DNA_END=1254 /DNA_ORIENTATION=-